MNFSDNGSGVWIPLRPEHYEIETITSSQNGQNIYTYCLADNLKLQCDDLLRIQYTQEGVYLISQDHSRARGYIALLLGWEYLVSVPDRDARKILLELKEVAVGKFIPTSLYSETKTMISMEFLEDAQWVKLKYPNVQLVRSKLRERLSNNTSS